MTTFSVVLTIAVLLAVAVFILLYERQRAEEIGRDLAAPPTTPEKASPEVADGSVGGASGEQADPSGADQQSDDDEHGSP